MKIRHSIPAATAAAVFLAAPALAKGASIWLQCDGYPKPEDSGVKIVKGLAALSTLGIFGIPEHYDPDKRAFGEAGVAACQEALANGAAASGPWIRRVTLNQALAIHQLEAKKPEAALAAVVAARAAAGENASNPYYARSTGVSLDLLETVAQLQLGHVREGVATTRRAAAARPWSIRVQATALAMLSWDDSFDEQKLLVVDRLRRLNPGSNQLAGDLLLRAGRYKEAWELLRPAALRQGPAKSAIAAFVEQSGMPVAAFAAARAGDKQGSDAVVAKITESAHAVLLPPDKAKLPAGFKPVVSTIQEKQLLAPLERWRPMIDAANLLNAGDARAAQDRLLSVSSWPGVPLLADLVADIRAKLPEKERRGLVLIDPKDIRGKVSEAPATRMERIHASELFKILPEPEDETRLNAFSKQFGLGLKPTGFKDKKLDSGLTRIEYVGSVSSPVAVEEMTLLRAAQLALAAGQKGFVIEDRADYTRMRQMTMRGMPVGTPTLAGYMTQLDVRFTDLSDPRAVDAAKVAAELKPVYARPEPARR
jgi:hypothetical protein